LGVSVTVIRAVTVCEIVAHITLNSDGLFQEPPGDRRVFTHSGNFVPESLPAKLFSKPAMSYPNSLDESIRTNPPALLSIGELAFVLGLSPRAVHNYVARGLIPRVKLGRRVLFRWTQVQASLAKLEKAGG